MCAATCNGFVVTTICRFVPSSSPGCHAHLPALFLRSYLILLRAGSSVLASPKALSKRCRVRSDAWAWTVE